MTCIVFFRFRNIKVPPDWFLGAGVVWMSAGWEALSCRICRSKILTPRNQQVGLVGEAPCRNHSNHLPSSHHHRIWGVAEVLLLEGLGNFCCSSLVGDGSQWPPSLYSMGLRQLSWGVHISHTLGEVVVSHNHSNDPLEEDHTSLVEVLCGHLWEGICSSHHRQGVFCKGRICPGLGVHIHGHYLDLHLSLRPSSAPLLFLHLLTFLWKAPHAFCFL